jgi:ribosomal protein S18 acetylase RimI-like enzyme
MFNIIIDELHPEKIRDYIKSELKNYNYAYLGPYNLQRFALYITDQKGAIISGLYGFILAKHYAVRIEFIWTKAELRNQHLASTLIHKLEEYAKCHFIQASTMSFQAVGFYEKLGFQHIGTIPKWFCGHDELFYLKKIN